MYKIRHAGAKGLGVFATQRIACGTRIKAEKPLITVGGESQVYAAARSLSPSDMQVLRSLSSNVASKLSILDWVNAAWHIGRDVVSSKPGSSPATESYLGRLRDAPRLLDVFRTNNFDIGNATQAVFGEIARFNHACSPNAQGNFNSLLGCFTIHAVRAIEVGEELTLSYLAQNTSRTAQRQEKLLKHYGFSCDCPACDESLPANKLTEQKRLHFHDKQAAFHEAAEGRDTPDQQGELEVVMALIDHAEASSLLGRELATMYITAAEMAARLGLTLEVVRYAERGLELDAAVLGEDNPMFAESVARARAVGVELSSRAV